MPRAAILIRRWSSELAQVFTCLSLRSARRRGSLLCIPDSGMPSRAWGGISHFSGRRSSGRKTRGTDTSSTSSPPGRGGMAISPLLTTTGAPILGQVSLGSLTTDLFRRLGVSPDAAIGYSMGESAAPVSLGAWTDRDEMTRRLMASPLFATELAGTCAAARRSWNLQPGEPVDWVAGIVSCSSARVERAIGDTPRVYVLIINSAEETLIGGRRREVEAVVNALGCSFVELPTVSTVHCEIGRCVETEYRALHDLPTSTPAGITFYSGVWARPYQPDRSTAADAITAQATGRIDFPAVIERAYADGVRVFLEMGPGGSCTRLIDRILGSRPHLARSACLPGRDAAGHRAGCAGKPGRAPGSG